ncbi:hypothetical protein CBER1_02041 [Cercospora berteroae]|uniref:FAD-binding domain-containing protein n=1 Tax=Cercospora berteroae TaxID=357750 RepID=A0A2S6CMR5_9PEZI|nr:hypothetical protein CBER1_02041 [Cercospora berteroae]
MHSIPVSEHLNPNHVSIPQNSQEPKHATDCNTAHILHVARDEMDPALNILINGAGIAGTTAAFFLAQAGARVTILERSSALRKEGQAVDVRGHGLAILRRMGLERAACERATGEAGLQMINAQGHCSVEFPVADGSGFTGGIEIVRGELVSLLWEATRSKVEYIFGESIETLSSSLSGIDVTFTNSGRARHFDIVIGADGWASTTRKLAFGHDVSAQAIHPLGRWVVWFNIPRISGDGEWARWYVAPGKRMLLLRPETSGTTGVSLWISDLAFEPKQFASASLAEQKTVWATHFRGLGWQEARLLDGFNAAEHFHTQEIVQVKLEALTRDRVALVGDAASCPCPISGLGTTIAFVSSYVLAREIVNNPRRHKDAFDAYEGKMVPFTRRAQVLAPCAPGMINLSSIVSIWLLHLLILVTRWSGVVHAIAAFYRPPAAAIDLSVYDIGPVEDPCPSMTPLRNWLKEVAPR